VINKGCFFHLGKNLWKKIQEAKLVTEYRTDLDLFVKWFENTYALGKVRKELSNGDISRNQPLYPPELCSNHLGVYSIIEEMQKEQQRVDCQVKRILNGEQRSMPKKRAIDHEK
ncbi:24023_t:CDS:2, partial [Dentiscutata erythropus]